MSFNWYLIQAKSKKESLAESSLNKLGVETLCPRFELQKINRCKEKLKKKSPLFPGYLFVRIDISNEFRKVAYAHGVLGIVKFGSIPAVVEEEIIQSIMARDDNGVVALSPFSPLQPGQAVLISHGHFRGFEAVFEQALNGMERVALLLKTVAYQGRIVIGRDCLTV